jgi:hypothetical protein
VRRTAATLFAAAHALGAVAASHGEDAPDPSDHPCYDTATDTLSFPQQQVFIHEGDTKIGNGSAAPWDTNPPEASVQDGAGAGAVTGSDVIFSTGGQDGPGATFAGTFDGCIDTLLFDVYSFDPTNRTGTGGSAQPANHTFS